MDESSLSQSYLYARGILTDDGLPAPYGLVLVQGVLPAPDEALLRERLPRLPKLQLGTSELFDLELVASGAYSPLTGFMSRPSYESVLNDAALPDGRPWGLPVTLGVTRDAALSIRSGQEAALCRGHEIVGVIQVDEIYPWDPVREARLLGMPVENPRTDARRRGHIAYLVGGPIAFLAARGSAYMQSGHQWPLELRGHFVRQGWRHVSIAHLHHPWRRTHEYLLRCALESSDGLLWHEPVGPYSDVSALPPDIVADASRSLIENHLPVQRVVGNPLPGSLLASSARATLMHAILGQNYGAGMMFVPASQGDAAGELRELMSEASRHGLKMQPAYMPAAFHCDPCGGIATEKSCPHESGQHVEISDDEIAAQLQQGAALSPIITRPELARMMARRMAELASASGKAVTHNHVHPHQPEVSRELRQLLSGHKPCALWMTGLSGSGKSTIAHRLERELLLAGHRVFVVDGDNLRHGLNRDLGFSEADRRENLRRAAEVVKVMVEAGMIVIVSLISPFRAERQMVREILGDSFREIFVDADLSVCEERDPKGLYQRARSGQIPHFTGISSPYEPPESPDARLDTRSHTVESCVAQLREFLAANGILRSVQTGRWASGAGGQADSGIYRIQ